MINNFSNEKTPTTSVTWIQMTMEDRIEMIYNSLKKNILYKDFVVVKASDNGHVVLQIEHVIPVNIISILLLDIETLLKKDVDQGITLWCEPVGDKSKLRQLRGVKINT
jgi:hypothetical protein